jgi:hypothetical protein
VPVYFLEGRHDVNTMPSLVMDYFMMLDAPHKDLVWFERSGHKRAYRGTGQGCRHPREPCTRSSERRSAGGKPSHRAVTCRTAVAGGTKDSASAMPPEQHCFRAFLPRTVTDEASGCWAAKR